MTVRVGIVGSGAMAEQHAAALQRWGAGIVAVASPDRPRAESLARSIGNCGAVGSTAELYRRFEPDAVVIATPNQMHAAQAIEAVRAGCHVLVEIPVAMSAAEAVAVADASARTGRHVAVAHTLRFCRPYRAVRDLVRAGEIDPTHLVGRLLMLRQEDTGYGGRPRRWTDHVLWHHGAHLVDIVLWLLGTDEATVAGVTGPDWPGSGHPMDVGMLLSTADRRLASLALSYHSRVAARDLMIISTSATLHVDGPVLRSGDEVLVDCGSTATMEREAFSLQDKQFLDAVRHATVPDCTVHDVLPAMRLLDQVARTGRPAPGTGAG